jgi:hypothetical protein
MAIQRLAKTPSSPQMRVFRLPPDGEGKLQVGWTDTYPHAEGDRVPSGQAMLRRVISSGASCSISGWRLPLILSTFLGSILKLSTSWSSKRKVSP